MRRCSSALRLAGPPPPVGVAATFPGSIVQPTARRQGEPGARERAGGGDGVGRERRNARGRPDEAAGRRGPLRRSVRSRLEIAENAGGVCVEEFRGAHDADAPQ